jgi:uncharacterized protein
MSDYRIRVVASPQEIDAEAWNGLLQQQTNPNLFMHFAFLSGLHTTGCASAATGWDIRFILLEQNHTLVAATVVYLKTHSYGEYVFDWAWAQAYQRHGLPYYPKALVAVPFSPVPGARLLATNDAARYALVGALLEWCKEVKVSSLHILFASDADAAACSAHPMMLRHTVQFHWHNAPKGYRDFDEFLACLTQDKRKKIRQERRKVSEAGVVFVAKSGQDILQEDWDFFYRCYERTYLEHGNAPYLNQDFFQYIAQALPEHWVMFVAYMQDRPVACSLVALHPEQKIAYGRYWGCLEKIDCLHFEACYYQPLEWCIKHGYRVFEGGAQGEHKMARALLPVKTTSAHWLLHPSFATAVADFLERENAHQDHYLQHLEQRHPYKKLGSIGDDAQF